MSRLASNAELLGLVREKLELDWSPEQIAQWLKQTHAGGSDLRVSHEMIYRTIYLAGRTGLGRVQRDICDRVVR